MRKRISLISVISVVSALALICILVLACDFIPSEKNREQANADTQVIRKTNQLQEESVKSATIEKPTQSQVAETAPKVVGQSKIVGSILPGKYPYTVSRGNTPKMIVSAYEYPKCERCGKLHCMEIVSNHNNKSLVNKDPVSTIATYPYGNELLLVATLNNEKLDISNAKVRWTIHEPSGYYGKDVRPSFIKAAGVPEGNVQLSTDQVITSFGDGPVYVQIPQGIKWLRECSGDPICPIEIAGNQTWVLVYSPSPGLTNFLVNLVQPGNVNYPKVDYSVKWTDKIPNLQQCVDLEVNVTEDVSNPDPHVFSSSIDQVLKWKIDIKDVTDYYKNPNVPGVLPILYPIIDYDLRFRRDPLQWDAKNWADVYKVTIDSTINAATEYDRRLKWECKYNKGIPSAKPAILSGLKLEPESSKTFMGYTAFKAHQSVIPSKYWGDDHYYKAVQRSVDASLCYASCCKSKGVKAWHNITDESISIEFEPGADATISGLEVTWITGGQIQLKNTGSAPVYEIFLEKASGTVKRGIKAFLPAGGIEVISIADDVNIEKGDWIWYLVYSTNNTEPCCSAPVVARQKKVRVQ